MEKSVSSSKSYTDKEAFAPDEPCKDGSASLDFSLE